jgi:hypothetical protein
LSQSSPEAINSPDFRDKCNNQLKDLSGTVTVLRTELQTSGGHKGLDFYDPSSNLQTLLKDMINIVKNLLDEVSSIFGNDIDLGKR